MERPQQNRPDKRREPDLDSPELRRERQEHGSRHIAKGGTTRRGFLLGAAGLASAAAMGLDRVNMGDLDVHEKTNAFKTALEKKYGVRIVMGADRDQNIYTGDMGTLKQYADALVCLSEEFGRYGAEMIRSVGEERGFEIRIVSKPIDVSVRRAGHSSGLPVGGLAPFLKEGKPSSIVLAAGSPEEYQRRVINHELNHRFAEKWDSPEARDRRWMHLHAAVSGSPYAALHGPISADAPPSPDKRYFLTMYASQSPLEDQAVCAEWMTTPRLHAEFRRRIEHDPDARVRAILQAKYDETRRSYYAWSQGKLGKEFWEQFYEKGVIENIAAGKG